MAHYDERVLRLMEEIRAGARQQDKKQEKRLAALLKEAKALSDDALTGFAHYHYADRYYFMAPDYQKFRRHLNLAVRCLLDSEDRETLGKAYNLVAIDAHNVGSYAIAYQYYLTALKIGETARQSALRASVGANIGRLLMELEYHESAKAYLAQSLQQMKTYKNSMLYVRNMATICYLNGINKVSLGQPGDALEDLVQIERYLTDCAEEEEPLLRLMLNILHVRIVLAGKNRHRLEEMIGEILPVLRQLYPVYDMIGDIGYLVKPLIAGGELTCADRILSETGERIMHCGITHTERLFFEMRLLYDRAAGHKRRVLEDMKELHARICRQEEEQNERTLQTIELSAMMAELRLRHKETVQENVILQQQADTDALTGLPNRYAMNDRLEAAFDRALAGQKELVIGILDVDYFKEYNDTYGHQAGDVCLNAIAGILHSLVRKEKGVFCARYGGDEFVLLLEEGGKKKIEEIARTLHEEIFDCRIRHAHSRTSAYVTVTQGYCTGIPEHRVKIWDYLAEADKALYEVKKARGSLAEGALPVRICGLSL
ncbi:MAG: GGDEF domain-containing protein [Lachnospiraceae bacterium]|nr:GGDEF domain-containing protein [Lachnospiraceae bacterium]